MIGHLKRKHPQIYSEAVEKEKAQGLTSFFPTQGASNSAAAQEPATIIKFPATRQSIQEMAVETVTTNGLPLSAFEKSGIAKMIAPMLDQLNLKLTAANVREMTIDSAKRKLAETREVFSGKMVSVKVDLCTRRGRNFMGI